MEVCALVVDTGSGSGSGSGSATPNGCAIICTADTQCPTGMTCTAVPMQTVKICVPS
jgi:hypothetical protein